MKTLIVISFLAMLFFIGGAVLCRHLEKKEWNNGKCTNCGTEWKNFDTDSQGGRGYSCPKCDKTIWISYNVDKKVKL